MPKCTECGKEIFFLMGQSGNWTYKQKTPTSEGVSEQKYQCSYTCYNHAKLRSLTERKHSNRSQYIKDVKTSEESMICQGKKILHPIDLTKLKPVKKYFSWEEQI